MGWVWGWAANERGDEAAWQTTKCGVHREHCPQQDPRVLSRASAARQPHVYLHHRVTGPRAHDHIEATRKAGWAPISSLPLLLPFGAGHSVCGTFPDTLSPDAQQGRGTTPSILSRENREDRQGALCRPQLRATVRTHKGGRNCVALHPRTTGKVKNMPSPSPGNYGATPEPKPRSQRCLPRT